MTSWLVVRHHSLEGADFQTEQKYPLILNALFVTMFYWYQRQR